MSFLSYLVKSVGTKIVPLSAHKLVSYNSICATKNNFKIIKDLTKELFKEMKD